MRSCAGFLAAANDLLRVKDSPDVVETFYRSVEELPAARKLQTLRSPYAELARARLFEEERVVPPLDPLLPAIARAVEYWSNGEPVVIAHDRQTTLSPERIAWLRLDERLAGLELVGSFSNSRVQVADFLAGVARKIASDQLKGEDDAELTALIRPYLDPLAVWADAGSWARLSPPTLP